MEGNRGFRGAARRPPLASAPADLILNNARVITMDPVWPEAEAIAISGEQILGVGSARNIEPLRMYLREVQVDRTYLGGRLVFER